MSAFSPNDGSRHSRLLLARLHTGQLDEAHASDVRAHLTDADRAYLAELDAARDQVPALDIASLRAVMQPVAAGDTPANTTRWFVWGALAIAAVALLLVAPGVVRQSPEPEQIPTPQYAVRGERSLFVRQLIGDSLRDYDGRALTAGDTIALAVHPGGARGVVVISIDGDGAASVLYPDSGLDREPLSGDGRSVPLSGTLVLDDAPGPETLIAVFDRPVHDVLVDAADRYERDGIDGLMQWAQADPSVDIAVVERL